MQEFEQINGYYSVPELIRKPVDPVKAEPTSTEKDKPAPTTASPSVPAEKDIKEGEKKVISNFTILLIEK